MAYPTSVDPGLTQKLFYNPEDIGAIGNGVADDTAIIQTELDHGGVVILPLGHSFLISAPLNFSVAGTVLFMHGATLIPSAGFSGAELFNLTADRCGVMGGKVAYANTTSGSNPAANGVEVTGARQCFVEDIEFSYLNGWAIESVATASINNAGLKVHNLHVNHCAQGIHSVASAFSNHVGQQFFTNIHLETIDNGDGILFEDVNDMQVTNLDGAVAGGGTAGSMIHVKGDSSIFFTNIDIGAITRSTVSPNILIEAGTSGNPSNVTVIGGVAQSGNQAVQITNGGDILFSSMKFKRANLDGIQITGNSGLIQFDNCVWGTNNQSAGTAYDADITTSSSNIYFRGCSFETPVGASAGQVTNPATDSNHKAYFLSCSFIGTSTTPSTVFNATPQIVRGCVGYNPRGSITPPTITASPFSSNTSQNDVNIIFTNLNGGAITAFKINGTSVGVPTLGVAYHVMARTSVEIDYTTAAPTWVWIAD